MLKGAPCNPVSFKWNIIANSIVEHSPVRDSRVNIPRIRQTEPMI